MSNRLHAPVAVPDREEILRRRKGLDGTGARRMRGLEPGLLTAGNLRVDVFGREERRGARPTIR